MPHTKPQTSPIKDINKNGYLDGEDILAQLKEEEAPGSTRAAHGILEATLLRTYAKEVSRLVHKGIINATSYTLRTTQMLELRLTKMANDAQKREHQGVTPEIVAKAAAELAALNGQTPEQTQATIANAKHSYAFGKTFAETFPNGVKIDAKDMPEIMKHLGQIAPPAMPLSPEEEQKQQKDVYKRS